MRSDLDLYPVLLKAVVKVVDLASVAVEVSEYGAAETVVSEAAESGVPEAAVVVTETD